MKRNHAYRTMLLGVSLACLLGWAPRRARGQAATTGAIVGTVTDTSGAVIADADVTITNVCTQQGRVVKTNSSGIFDAEALPAAGTLYSPWVGKPNCTLLRYFSRKDPNFNVCMPLVNTTLSFQVVMGCEL